MENLNLKNLVDKTVLVNNIPGIVVSDPLPETVGKYRCSHKQLLAGPHSIRALAFNYEEDGIELTALRVLIAPTADLYGTPWFSLAPSEQEPSGIGTWFHPNIFSQSSKEIAVETAKLFVGNARMWNDWGKDEMGCFHTGGDGMVGMVLEYKRKKNIPDKVRFADKLSPVLIPGGKTGIVAVSISLDFDADMVSPAEAVGTVLTNFNCNQ